jgi:mono/diheme cytochrome c family protein
LTRGGCSALVLATLAGCGPKPTSENPTYVSDVEPILRGNCFHCHGPAANPMLAQLRWDFYDPQDPQLVDVGVFAGITPAKLHVISFLNSRSYRAGSPTQMPPPPATVLADRDVETLGRWWMQGAPRGQRADNHPPTATWLARGKAFVVEDRDHEQVLGKITCGAASAQLDRSGAHELPPGAQPPCTATLFDGQALARDLPLP